MGGQEDFNDSVVVTWLQRDWINNTFKLEGRDAC